jgi:hypothetical protein
MSPVAAWKAKQEALRKAALEYRDAAMAAEQAGSEEGAREARAKLEAAAQVAQGESGSLVGPTTRWLAKDEWEPGADPEWDDGVWLMPLDPGDLVPVVRLPKPAPVPTATSRTGTRPRTPRHARSRGSRSPPDDPSDPSPESPPGRPELGRLDVASSRLWAHVRRREAKGRLAA